MSDRAIQKEQTATTTLFFVAMLIFVFGAVGGFVYEMLFYRVVLGHFVKRGTTFGPWIPIYGVGSLLIACATGKYRKNPLVVFALSVIITGVLECAVGYALFHWFGVRLWDYNTEPLNFGNVGGYICFRSVFVFGLLGLILMFSVVPSILWLQKNISARAFGSLSLALGLLFLADIVVHLTMRGLTM